MTKPRLTEEEKLANRRALELKHNSKRSKEYNTIQNKKAWLKTKNNPVKLKILADKVKAFNKQKLEKSAGRPKPLNCEICNSVGKICYDHCHKNHHFRGWICDRCNKVLGLVKDNSDLLSKLKNYIDEDKLKFFSIYEDNDGIPF